MKRRSLLKAGLATVPIAIAVKAGLLWPTRVLAADWPADAFFATDLDEAVRAMFDGEITEGSDRVRVKAPDLAENGATVPITVETSVPPPFVISLFSVNNPTPAVARFEISEHLDASIATRIKMARTGEVVAVVSSGGQHLSARRLVKVTTGGCS